MFRKNRQKQAPPPQPSAPEMDNNNVSKYDRQNNVNSFKFSCQLAHGSPTVFISGFSSVKELYGKIAQELDMDVTEILFCTLNTYKLDMKQLLATQIGLEDFIFAHRKGGAKEVELVKSEDALGLTITDNGNGIAFIKRIKEGSTVHKAKHIMVGDHIQKLNGVDMVGKRHYDVAKALKEIPIGATFVIRLIEPMKTGFAGIGPKSKIGNKGKSMGTGRETIRFKADGRAEIEEKEIGVPPRMYNWKLPVTATYEDIAGVYSIQSPIQTSESNKRKCNYAPRSTKKPRKQTGKIAAAMKELKECDTMGKQIAVQLRMLPEHSRLRANFEIQRILMDYRIEHMNSKSNTSPATSSSGNNTYTMLNIPSTSGTKPTQYPTTVYDTKR